MKIAILGGTGRVGRLIVGQAIEADHQVAVVTRSSARLGSLAGRVSLIQGDVADPAALDQLVKGAEAVISALGPTRGAPANLMTRAISHVIEAMRAGGVKRIVILTNTSVSGPGDSPTLPLRILHAALSVPLGRIDGDHAGQVEQLLQSGLDWTVVRAVRLVDRPAGGAYRVGSLDRATGSTLGRADLAAFMLRCAVERLYVRKLPLISY